MRSLSLARLELRRLLTGRRIVAVAIAVILVVPLLYGALYLWAFWNPYAKVSQIPVAVVNEDVAARSGDTTLTAGADIVKELRDSGAMRWEVMSSAEASAALADHRVYLALVIPHDFSARLATADTSRPTTATMTLVADEADSMLASQIGERVFAEVRSSAAESVSRGYFDAMWVAIADARDGFSTAATGAVQLRDGLVDARDGSLQLRDGLTTAKDGATTLTSGLGTLATGGRSLAAGAKAASGGASTLAGKLAAADAGAAQADGGARSLASGLGTLAGGLDTLAAGGTQLTAASSQVAAGAAQVSGGVKEAISKAGQAADGASQLGSGASQVAAALKAYAAAHPDAASDPTFAAALAGSQQVAGGLDQLASQLSAAAKDGRTLMAGATQVSDGAAALKTGLGTYVGGVSSAQQGAAGAYSGARQLVGGTGQLASGMSLAAAGAKDLAGGTALVASGASRIASGAVTAHAGAVTLTGGLGSLSTGSRTLASGLGDALAGSRDLASGLRSAVATMPNDPQSVTDAKSSMMSDPVALDTVKRTEVANYGTGFAPYFIPLALWVGALVTFFLLKPVSGRALLSSAPDFVVALAGYLPAALIGALQAVIMLFVVQAGLGLHLKLPLLSYGMAVLAGLASIALVQWLSLALGNAPGKLAGIVLLMLQLTSAGGTFPIETVPGFFQAIHPWLPMTYVVEGLRQTIAGGDLTVIAHCALALAAFLALGLAGTLVTVHRQRSLTMERLHPALSL